MATTNTVISTLENQPFRPFVVLDDVREPNQLVYLNFNCDTIVTTTNENIASKLNRENIMLNVKVSILLNYIDKFSLSTFYINFLIQYINNSHIIGKQEFISEEHCKKIVASITDSSITNLPSVIEQLIEITNYSTFFMILLGILIQQDNDKWSIFDNQWLSKYRSQYESKIIIYDLIEMHLRQCNENDINQIMQLCIFNQKTVIPIKVLSMYWNTDSQNCRTLMNFLAYRSLATEEIIKPE